MGEGELSQSPVCVFVYLSDSPLRNTCAGSATVLVLSCSILPGAEGLCILWRAGTPFQSCEPVMLTHRLEPVSWSWPEQPGIMRPTQV